MHVQIIASIDPENQLSRVVDEINNEHRLACASARQTIDHALRCGELLAEVKAGMQHGEFLPWLQVNFEGTPRTAQRYVRLYSHQKSIAGATSVRAAQRLLEAPKPNATRASHLTYVDQGMHHPVGRRKKGYDIWWSDLAIDVICLDADGCDFEAIVEATEMPPDEVAAILRPQLPVRGSGSFNVVLNTNGQRVPGICAEWYRRNVAYQVADILRFTHDRAAGRAEWNGLSQLAETVRTLSRGRFNETDEEPIKGLDVSRTTLEILDCVAFTDARYALRIDRQPVDFFEVFDVFRRLHASDRHRDNLRKKRA